LGPLLLKEKHVFSLLLSQWLLLLIKSRGKDLGRRRYVVSGDFHFLSPTQFMNVKNSFLTRLGQKHLLLNYIEGRLKGCHLHNQLFGLLIMLGRRRKYRGAVVVEQGNSYRVLNDRCGLSNAIDSFLLLSRCLNKLPLVLIRSQASLSCCEALKF
jgi:hypothetical protein